MDYAESVTLITQFKARNPDLVLQHDVSGIAVIYDEQKRHELLEIAVSSPTAIQILRQQLGERFEYEHDGVQKAIGLLISLSGPYYAHEETFSAALAVRGGDTAAGIDLMGHGTAGWTIYLNDKLVCISNWHVLCGKGNATPIGERVLLRDQNIASLYAFQPVHFGVTRNSWDYALAIYDSPADVVGQMRPCHDGTILPYPGRLSNGVTFGDGAIYYKVGAKEPLCRTGVLRGVGSVRIKYHDNGNAWFDNQLIFGKMTDAGDSGAVIVRQSDHSVTGLSFAGNNERSLANPIFRFKWSLIGTMKLNTGAEIPVFSGETAPIFGASHNVQVSDTESLEMGTRVRPFGDIPQLSAGKVYLGYACADIATGLPDAGQSYKWLQPNRVLRWIVPAPAPIRPIGVEFVPFNFRGTEHRSIVVEYMCFG